MPRRFFLLLFSLSPAFHAFGQEGEIQTDTVSTVVITPPKTERTESFSTITEKETIAVRRLPSAQIESLKQSDDYWYANLEAKKKDLPKQTEPTRGQGLFVQRWFRNLLWLIVLFTFIGIVIWYLASSNANLFRKQARKIADESEEGSIDEDIFSIDYNNQIQKAIDAQNYRLAVRLLYLQTLKDLSDSGLIKFRTARTNSDYVNDLYGSKYYRDFFRLTRIFEYTWYGGFALDKEIFLQTQTAFQNFKTALSR